MIRYTDLNAINAAVWALPCLPMHPKVRVWRGNASQAGRADPTFARVPGEGKQRLPAVAVDGLAVCQADT